MLTIERTGKELHFNSEGHTLGVHLMLQGNCTGLATNKYNKALTIDDGRKTCYADSQQLFD